MLQSDCNSVLLFWMMSFTTNWFFTTEESLPIATEASNGERSEQLSILLRQPHLVYLHHFISERGTGGVIKSGFSLSHLTQPSLRIQYPRQHFSDYGTRKNIRLVSCIFFISMWPMVQVVQRSMFSSIRFHVHILYQFWVLEITSWLIELTANIYIFSFCIEIKGAQFFFFWMPTVQNPQSCKGINIQI